MIGLNLATRYCPIVAVTEMKPSKLYTYVFCSVDFKQWPAFCVKIKKKNKHLFSKGT